MTFEKSQIDGVWLLRCEAQIDERGWFARTFCSREFSARGLASPLSQSNLSFNHQRATMRGMHWQQAPYGEVKLVRCMRGAIWDVVADVRPGSPTHGSWQAFELNEGSPSSLYIPEGVAHGFLTLRDETLVHYQMSGEYSPSAARGLRWDDPTFAISWPIEPAIISGRDRQWPDWHPRVLHPASAEKGGVYAGCR